MKKSRKKIGFLTAQKIFIGVVYEIEYPNSTYFWRAVIGNFHGYWPNCIADKFRRYGKNYS